MRKFIAATAALVLVVALSSCSGEEDFSVDLQPITEAGPGPFTDPVGTGRPLAAAVPAPADAQRLPAEPVEEAPAAGEEPGGEAPAGQQEPAEQDPGEAEEPYGGEDLDEYGQKEEQEYEEAEEPAEEEHEEENGGEDEHYADRPTGVHEGGAEGLYGHTPQEVPCDKDALIAQLRADEDKGRAWAEALEISPDDIEREVHEMTPLVLRNDTLVTNHSYHGDGEWEGFLALMEAGTAVLVDEYGAPAVRCACGNPLREPEHGGDPVQPEDLPDIGSPEGEETYEGEAWDGAVPAASTVVAPSQERLTEIVATDLDTGEYSYIEVADEEEHEEAESGEDPDTGESPEPAEAPGEPEGGTEPPQEGVDEGEGGGAEGHQEEAPAADPGPDGETTD